ncbi:Uncharacterized protein BP5553_04744 [Venustampulla echinocandica]|uniref:Phosphoglycerate mutase-like protein n=1 Tax=Venustampulla echinocandica TaxID=2656787 RepID=A0A370TP58_9HELO|nr:Uncharacterized protein BP5553_04744 [Venustampulla echinocandica]RDL37311.1 Uncharacterized protein BP5553_04744 [Venustampulla echinocandica]
MTSLFLTAFLSLSATASAATSGNQNQVTWASVVFTYHGEKIPFFHQSPYNLTPLGANQLLQAGQAVRSRYISPPTNGSQADAKPINGISMNGIENSQMDILSTSDEYVSASALAFMQGLYPPRSTATAVVDEESMMGSGSLLQFPLSGYQYPNVRTLSDLDFNYIWLAGDVGCTNYSINQVNTLASSAFTSQMAANEIVYQNLADSLFRDLDSSVINYANAENLYEYALFEYNHNTTVQGSLSPATLDQLHSLASAQQQAFNSQNGGNGIGAIAGRTIASKAFQQLSHNIASGGISDKLTLMFGSFQPFLSFFELSGLSAGPSASTFQTLPDHGSMMAFELFSYSPSSADGNATIPFPNTADLWVRFLFRNGSSEDAPMVSYALFGNGNQATDMSWSDFSKGIEGLGLNGVEDWCSACQSSNLFCKGIEDNLTNYTLVGTKGRRNKNKISPAIAGVIGATTTLGLFILLSSVLCLLGFRIDHREEKKGSNHGDLGGLRRSGGFKGAEKLASDTDLTVKGTTAGASVVRHERVGSWELNESPTSPGRHSSLDKEIESGRRMTKADYSRRSEDGIGSVNPFGDPVKPVDQV